MSFLNPTNVMSLWPWPGTSNNQEPQNVYDLAGSKFQAGARPFIGDTNAFYLNQGMQALALGLQADLNQLKTDMKQVKAKLNVVG